MWGQRTGVAVETEGAMPQTASSNTIVDVKVDVVRVLLEVYVPSSRALTAIQ